MNRIDLLDNEITSEFYSLFSVTNNFFKDSFKYLKRISSFSISPSRKLENHLLANFLINSKLFWVIELYSLRQGAKVSWEFENSDSLDVGVQRNFGCLNTPGRAPFEWEQVPGEYLSQCAHEINSPTQRYSPSKVVLIFIKKTQWLRA